MNDELQPRRGALAFCSIGRLGLILCDEPQEISYPDGNTGIAWTGIQLTPGMGGKDNDVLQRVGDPWSSRHPRVVGYIEELHIFE